MHYKLKKTQKTQTKKTQHTSFNKSKFHEPSDIQAGTVIFNSLVTL